jgi:hypothetical protein
MPRLTRVPVFCFIAAVLISGVSAGAALRDHGPQSQPAARTWRIADAPADLKPAIARADLIVVEMHDTLIRELKGGLERGPEFAMRSCHIDVASVLRRLERQEGIAAGRTSDRLRNPANAPPSWAAPLVRTHVGGTARDLGGFVVDLGPKIGVLRPIAHRPMCASCHGPTDRLSPAVRETLSDRYPSDRATGYKEGDLRGWYWVEIPKTSR